MNVKRNYRLPVDVAECPSGARISFGQMKFLLELTRLNVDFLLMNSKSVILKMLFTATVVLRDTPMIIKN